jgi:histidyl-tRNA synthetase
MFDQGLTELKTVVRYLGDFGVPAENFAVDLTIARGLDYYTGTVYETAMLDHPEIGSICSGGRYDNLAEYYTEKQLPGVGISIGLTRLFFVLEDQGLLNDDLLTAPADVLVLPMTEDLSPAIAAATALRQAGVRTQIHAEQKKFKQKLSYADKLGIPYVLLLGEDEIAQGKVALKDLATGQQALLTIQQAAAQVSAGLAARNSGAPIREPEHS